MTRTNQTVEEMRELRISLNKRANALTARMDELKAEILENPTDRVISRNIALIHDLETEAELVYRISLNSKFDIEDITGEEEP